MRVAVIKTIQLLGTIFQVVGTMVLLTFRNLAVWCRKNPSQAMTAILVLGIHFSVIAYYGKQRSSTILPIAPKVLAVNTIKLKPPKPQAQPQPTSPPRPQSIPSTSRAVPPPKPIAAKPQKPVPKPVVKPPPKKPVVNTPAVVDKKALQQRQDLIDKALASLDQVQKPATVKPNRPPKLPTLGRLSIDGNTGSTEGVDPRDLAYCEELIHRLQLALTLPEVGDVRVKLTIDRDGKVGGVTIMSSKSTHNSRYLEETLPTLTFPPFGKNFIGESKHGFLLVLSNAT